MNYHIATGYIFDQVIFCSKGLSDLFAVAKDDGKFQPYQLSRKHFIEANFVTYFSVHSVWAYYGL